MNKEENKKINYLKELTEYKLFLDNILIKDKTARQILVSAYNKLERQQKEIKKEKSRIMELAELLDKQESEIKSLHQELEIQKGCSISKDKIRKFIKDELPDDEIMECCGMYDVNGVRLREELEKLLEEK